MDTSRFNDDIADEVSWDALRGLSFGLSTLKPNAKDPHTLVFSPTLLFKILIAFSFVFGVAILFVFLQVGHIPGKFFTEDKIITIVAGAVFIGAAVFMWGVVRTAPSFDLSSATIKKRSGLTQREISFSDVHALQLIEDQKSRRRRVGSGRHRYTSYQIIAVLNDASREFIISYLDAETARADAQIISKYTGAKVWDAYN